MMLAAVEAVTEANPIWATRRHKPYAATEASAGKLLHCCVSLKAIGPAGVNEMPSSFPLQRGRVSAATSGTPKRSPARHFAPNRHSHNIYYGTNAFAESPERALLQQCRLRRLLRQRPPRKLGLDYAINGRRLLNPAGIERASASAMDAISQLNRVPTLADSCSTPWPASGGQGFPIYSCRSFSSSSTMR